MPTNEFKEIKETLDKSHINYGNFFEAYIPRSYKEALADGLFKLSKNNLLNQENFQRLRSVEHPDKFADGLVTLNQNDLLTETYINLIKRRSDDAAFFATGLVTLKKINISNDENIKLLKLHSDLSNQLANSLATFKNDDLLRKNFMKMVRNFPDNSEEFAQGLVILKQHNLVDKAHIDLINYSRREYAQKLAQGLVKLKESGLVDENTIKSMKVDPEYTKQLINGLKIVHQTGLLFKNDKIDPVMVSWVSHNPQYAENIAKALITLHQANILYKDNGDPNRNLIRQIHNNAKNAEKLANNLVIKHAKNLSKKTAPKPKKSQSTLSKANSASALLTVSHKKTDLTFKKPRPTTVRKIKSAHHITDQKNDRLLNNIKQSLIKTLEKDNNKNKTTTLNSNKSSTLQGLCFTALVCGDKTAKKLLTLLNDSTNKSLKSKICPRGAKVRMRDLRSYALTQHKSESKRGWFELNGYNKKDKENKELFSKYQKQNNSVIMLKEHLSESNNTGHDIELKAI